MGQEQSQHKIEMQKQGMREFIESECSSFSKLCTDIIRVLNIFSNDKYLAMIGFDLNVRVYFTPY